MYKVGLINSNSCVNIQADSYKVDHLTSRYLFSSGGNYLISYLVKEVEFIEKIPWDNVL